MTIRVNGEIVSQAAIDYELRRLVRFFSAYLTPGQLQEQMDTLRRKAREQAIGMKLLIAEANRLDLSVTEEEVEARYRAMEDEAGGAEALGRMMARQGLTPELLRENIRIGCRVDKLVAHIVAGTPEPSEEELRAHYAAHAAHYRIPARARVQHILIKPDSHREADREVSYSKLLEIRRRIEEGADFAEQAAAHSHCPSGRRAGGSLGWIVRGTMVLSIDHAVFAMRINELSDIVETKLGFHLLRKTAEEPERQAEFEEVKDRIRELLRHATRGEAIRQYVEELRAQATIEESDS